MRDPRAMRRGILAAALGSWVLLTTPGIASAEGFPSSSGHRVAAGHGPHFARGHVGPFRSGSIRHEGPSHLSKVQSPSLRERGRFGFEVRPVDRITAQSHHRKAHRGVPIVTTVRHVQPLVVVVERNPEDDEDRSSTTVIIINTR